MNKKKQKPLNKQDDMFRPKSTSRERALELLKICKDRENAKRNKI